MLEEVLDVTVFLDGRDITEIDVLSLRRRVGMLFQLPALFQGTVADNVRYGPQLRGKKISDKEVYNLLAMADLDSSFYGKVGSELSVGQQQRVALARTLANEPEVLLLDEPTSALDPISTQNVEDVLVKLKKERGMTVVMVSHSVKQIQRIADLVFLLVDGEIVEVVTPEKLCEAKHPMAVREQKGREGQLKRKIRSEKKMAMEDAPLDDKAKKMRDLLSSFYAPADPSKSTDSLPKGASLDAINTTSFDADQYMNLLVLSDRVPDFYELILVFERFSFVELYL
ncbi:ABC transporter I family member 17 [Linum perenne]